MRADETGAKALRVAGLVLAAGAGRRYGMPKALVPYEGSLLVERACRLIAEVCDPVVVVLGAAADEVRSRAELGDAEVVLNADWDTGMASSLRTGLAWMGALSGGSPASRQGGGVVPGIIDAVLVHLVDLPGMTVAAVRRLARAASPNVLAVASYAGVRGHPVLLGRTHWAGVAETATGDEGARGYLASHEVIEIECADVADPADLDYPPT
ncbi:MAG: nucleotidyltransferase family protein [Geodermatophilaceae bacterium]|nr:nucleotidyltransferase family protein [Geodermatophilaceae bacterium]